MAFQHGKDTVFKLGAADISAFCNTSNLNRTADTHNVTTYGKNAHVFNGGLLNGDASCGGIYDTTVGGPRAVIEPLIGKTIVVTRQPEGAGPGKPQDVVDAVVTSYVETNPVADMVTWTCGLQLSDDVDTTPQS